MSDPRCAAFDIETYGICRRNAAGRALPEQTVFHPKKSLRTDRVRLCDLVISACLTLPASDPREGGGGWTRDELARLAPGHTLFFRFDRPADVRCLLSWLMHLDTLFLMNPLFDLSYIRTLPRFDRVLRPHSHTIIDYGYVSYTQDDERPERSLKSIGPAVGAYRYDDEILASKSERFEDPRDPDLMRYNAEDTHNIFLGLPRLAARVIEDFPDTDKLSADAITFESDKVWSTLRMMEAGLPFSRAALERLDTQQDTRARRAAAVCARKYDLPIEGKGSQNPRYEFITRAMSEIDEHCDIPKVFELPGTRTEAVYEVRDSKGRITEARYEQVPQSILSHPLCARTEKTKKISCGDGNRRLARLLLPPTHPMQRPLRWWDECSHAQKLCSSYTRTLLHGAQDRANYNGQTTRILPLRSRPDIGLSHSNWFLLPSPIKDDNATEGGQRQGRIGAKNPAQQTFPPPIKKCIASRYPNGVIVCYDLSQIELRIAGLLSGEPAICDEYARELRGEKSDLHTRRAVENFGPDITSDPAFGCGDSAVDPRQWAKRDNFEDLYLAGPAKKQQMMIEEANVLKPLSYFQKRVAARAVIRPVLTAWQESLIDQCNTLGYIAVPITGQSRSFRGGTAYHKPNEMVNFPIQLTAANINLHIQIEVSKLLAQGDPIRVVLNVYDSIFFDTPTPHLSRLDDIYQTAFNTVLSTGYVACLYDHYARHVPVRYDRTVLPTPN